jgi:stearoyl-CoA desaturase (Delta-9 desaturase)
MHRLFAHRTYKAHFIVRFAFMLVTCCANQTSIFHWCRDHRCHHKHSETDADPHNATRGFFFAHIGWLLLKKKPEVVAAGKEMDFSDLWEDPIIRFQHALDPWIMQYMCFVFPAQVAHYCWGETWWNGFLFPGVVRWIYSQHFTFLVNSAAHLYGDHPYDVMSYPAENPLVSWFALGEGWHNWHHKYPYDYACSEYGFFVQYNPAKMLIDTLAAVGLVWDRTRATAAWARGRARRDKNAAAGIPLPKRPLRPWEVSKKLA